MRKFFHLPEYLGYEKLYTFAGLEEEIRKAGLVPLKRAGDYHEIGILAKKMEKELESLPEEPA